MKKALILCLGICLFFEISTALAQTEEAFYALGEIVVSGQANSGESVATVHTISQLEIQEKGVRTLDQALKLIPGIYIRYGAAGTPRIDIRGLRTRHVLLLLNGIPVKDTYDGQFDPTSIPVDHIAQIKVTTGGSSILYGAGGSAGIINVITRQGEKGVHGSVLGEFGPKGYYSTNATVTGRTQKADAILSIGKTERDSELMAQDFDETSIQDDDTRENSDHQRQNIFGGFNYALSDSFDLGFTANYQKGENGAPPSTINNKKDIFAPSVKYDRLEDMETWSFQGAFDYQFQTPFKLRGWAFFSQADTLTKRFDDNTYTTISKKGGYSQDATSKVNGLNLQLSFIPSNSNKITLAALMENDSWESKGYEIDKKENAVSFNVDSDLKFYSLALEYTNQMTDKLNLVLGYGFHAMEKDMGNDEEDFSCMAGLSYDLTDTTVVHGSWSRSIKFPTTKELYDQDGGNPDLTAETIHTWELGVQQELPAKTTVSVTGYIKDAEDFIEKDVDDMYLNYEEYRFKGVEIQVVNTWVENLRLTGTASLMTSKDKSANSEKDELQNRPEQKYSLEGTYLFPFGLTAQLSFLYVADQYYYSKNTPLEKARMDDFQVVDCKLSQAFSNNSVEVYLKAENLLDELYEQSYGFPCPGRTLYAGATYRF